MSSARRGSSKISRGPATLVAAAVVLLALVVIVWLLPDRVRTVTVERRALVEMLVTTGRVRSVSRAAVGTSLVGTVERVLVRAGDRVNADELLLALDDAELSAAAAEARAQLATAEASLRRIESVDQPTAAAALESAELEARQLAHNVERLRMVFEAGGVSLQQLESAQRMAEAARARYEGARALAMALGSGGADRLAAMAAIARARESRAVALARLELTRVRAPASGTVLIRSVEPGDAVQPGRVLMEIALDGPTELLAFPDERAVAGLRLGQRAVASADAYPEKQFAASVTRIAPVVDPQQGTIEVRLGVPEPPAYLLPDMTVSVNIELDRRVGAPTLPLETVRAPLTDTAWVLAIRHGRAVRVPVKVGIRDERFVEIVAGLEQEERIVAQTDDGVNPGDRVRARSPR